MFGYVPGVNIGSVFPDRKSLLAAGVHRQNQAGISGTEDDGAESIVVSGGYEDDIDEGDVIIYTGHGGRDPNSGKQVEDQQLTRGNLALAKNETLGIPASRNPQSRCRLPLRRPLSHRAVLAGDRQVRVRAVPIPACTRGRTLLIGDN
jgi:predicted restriction endonuclease